MKIIEKAAVKSGLFVVPITKALINKAICDAIGAVGPLTPTLHPPNKPPTIPPITAPKIPALGPNCEISPKAKARGKTIIDTIIPDKTSNLILDCNILIFLYGTIFLKRFKIEFFTTFDLKIDTKIKTKYQNLELY